MEDEISSENVRVGLDLTGARRRRLTGWERFALEYASALRELPESWCVPVALEGDHRPGGRVRTLFQQLAQYGYRGRRAAEEARADVFHALTFPPGDTKRPTVWTVHDDLVLGGHLEYARAGARLWVPLARRALRWTDRVVTDTRAVADELAELGVPEDKLRVVTPGVPDLGEPVRPTARPVRLDNGQTTALPEEFLLVVGTIEERKRTDLAARAAVKLGVPLLIVGRIDPGYRFEEWPPDTYRTEGVSDAELRWLYEHASALLALSRYEGLDFPLLEALSVGTPVIASDIPVHRELAGDSVALVPPDVDAVAEAARTLSQPEPRGLPTWSDCVEGYQRVYTELM